MVMPDTAGCNIGRRLPVNPSPAWKHRCRKHIDTLVRLSAGFSLVLGSA